MYEISELIDDKNTQLYKDIAAQFIVSLEHSLNDHWYASLKNEKVAIGVNSTNHPQACFSHELLHIKLRMMGYKTPMFDPGVNEKEHVEGLIGFFDDFLQHLKIYSQFTGLGYDGNVFLTEADGVHIKKTSRDVERFKKMVAKGEMPKNHSALILPLIVVKTPPQTEHTLRIEEKLKLLMSQETMAKIDKIIDDWAGDATLDPIEYFAELFRLMGMKGVKLAHSKDGRGGVVS
ncbi:hypothetical protein [Fundidesulfovibrio agrisoli]|uniref:hypothetical protein n=1 Tax=Fundidesulfovibrio agrisoli TaxID=2922717 RepID=UPI001FAB8763|nr:hypothetical protein [Fundidesulfovibrio agrisoli]